jgi:hypothetical protein
MNSVIDIAQRSFWKRLGFVGFTFFLVKGLAWLSVPAVMYLMGAVGR